MVVTLFKKGIFKSAAGILLPWKIECDALTDEDWETIAFIIASKCEFGSVFGVPTGGEKLAKALEKYITVGLSVKLVVDDVFTTGTTLKKYVGIHDIVWVVFARNQPPKNINALWTFTG